jgi:hypothetical protein
MAGNKNDDLEALLHKLFQKLPAKGSNRVGTVLDTVLEPFERLDGVRCNVHRRQHDASGLLSQRLAKPVGLDTVQTNRIMVAVPLQGSPRQVRDGSLPLNCLDLVGTEAFVTPPGF